MDVRAKNRGRPHQQVRLCAVPVMGRNFLTQGRPGVRVRNVRGKSGPKSLCLCCFFFPDLKQAQSGHFSGHFSLARLFCFAKQKVKNKLERFAGGFFHEGVRIWVGFRWAQRPVLISGAPHNSKEENPIIQGSKSHK